MVRALTALVRILEVRFGSIEEGLSLLPLGLHLFDEILAFSLDIGVRGAHFEVLFHIGARKLPQEVLFRQTHELDSPLADGLRSEHSFFLAHDQLFKAESLAVFDRSRDSTDYLTGDGAGDLVQRAWTRRCLTDLEEKLELNAAGLD